MKRENRYLVIKRKHLELLTDKARQELENIIAAIADARQETIDDRKEGVIDCVVEEKDWPMHEQVWRLIESWVDGQDSA